LPTRLPQVTVSTCVTPFCVGIIASQWAAAFTASGQGREPKPMPGDAVAVVLPPELPPDVVACVVGVEELPLLPLPPHAASVKLTMKTKKVAIKRDLECRK
jgi:hypothetical protein